MQRSVDGEQALGASGLFDLINIARLEGHWNRVGLVRTCVPKLAVDHDRDGYERCFAIRAQLKQPHGAWPSVFLGGKFVLARIDLRKFVLGGERAAPQ